MKIMINLIFLTIGFIHMAASQDTYEGKTDFRLHYRKQGSGETLILLHGWLQTGEFWAPYLDEFGEDFEVYAVDLPGHGKSSVITTSKTNAMTQNTDAMTQSRGISISDFSIRKASEDVVSFIRLLKPGKINAIGLSYGGLVLLEIMAAHPDLIERAVLIGVSNRFDGQEASEGKPPFGYDDLDPAFRDKLLREHFYGEEQVRALFDPALNYKIDINDKQLGRINTRVLIINGDRDEMTGIDGAIEIYKNVPEAQLWIMPGTGHLAINADSRQEFIFRVFSFLKAP